MIGYKAAGGTAMSCRRSTARNDSSDERSVRQKPRDAGISGNSGAWDKDARQKLGSVSVCCWAVVKNHECIGQEQEVR